jgi:predicted MFS family arabinose efflux permease
LAGLSSGRVAHGEAKAARPGEVDGAAPLLVNRPLNLEVKPLRLGLLSLVATLALVPLPQSAWLASGLLALALVTVGTFFAPTTSLLADACDLSGIPPVTAMTISNIAWAIGATVGAASGGAIADAAGKGAGYALLALIAISTLAALTVTLRPTSAKARDGRPASSPYGSE